MIFISHRGNVDGKNSSQENMPNFILNTLSLGYDVEIDVWFYNDQFFLGHDFPQYKIDGMFLNQPGLWIHCKNIAALEKLIINFKCNCFFHINEDVVLTSKRYLWTYPGKSLYSNSICVLPEIFPYCDFSKSAGICSDVVGKYKNKWVVRE